ncbi:MAG TPA: TolC family protein [Terriglobia bacterium]|nr:TolC family protein [Terriglobia bacterium]
MRLHKHRWTVAALVCGAWVALGAQTAGLRAQQPAQAAASAPAPKSETGSAPAIEYKMNTTFPNFFGAYTVPYVAPARMVNSPRLESLIRDGKLKLGIDDAIVLALEDNLDIAVARYQIPFAETDLLRARAGGATRGVTGAFQSSALFAGAIGGGVSGISGGGSSGAGGFSGAGGASSVGAIGCCDPTAGASFGWDFGTTPLNFTAVTGIPITTNQTTTLSTFYGQGFLSGTSYAVALFGERQSTTSISELFNPQTPTGLEVGINQHLLNGFGYRANAVFIRQAHNELKIADSVFRQQVITTIQQVLNFYSNLLADQEQVRVAQQAVTYAQRLLEDNKKQVEIGTLAPIEIVRAESEVATDEQALVLAQTTYLQQQEQIKTALSKRVSPELAAAEIEATDKLPEPAADDIPPLPEALKVAMQNRPEIEQADLNLANQDITIKSNRNRLLPTFDVFATWLPSGLSGDRLVRDPTTGKLVGVVPGGIWDSLGNSFHGTYPNYSYGANLTIPIRNRSAQADAARAMLEQRQLETQLQRSKNQIEQDVRNAEIAVTQAKAQINAAAKATELAKETRDAEQKKFKLGESTVFTVLQTERDYVNAQGNEVKARATYAQALVQYQQATATILDKYNVRMADAKTGRYSGAHNIPGTPETQSSGSSGQE